ncbi:MAG: hypothetical protein AAB214_10510, partial [Fibrobacterota bacterium]
AALLARSADLGIEGFQAIRQDLSGAGHEAFQTAWRRLRDSWDGPQVRFAAWLRIGFYPSQMQPVAQAAEKDPRFHFATVISEPVNLEFIDNIAWFVEQPFLHAPDPAWLSELEFLQVILGSEDKLDASGFPRCVRRVLQPHGIDIPLHNSIVGYGAGSVFDYVLCPSLNSKLQGSLSPASYKGLYPPELIEHGSTTVTGIPAGYPKLDKFLRAARDHVGEATKIVYHLSSWWLETPWVRENAAKILGALLSGFPDRVVIFRPMTKNLHEPRIQAIIDEFRQHPRFQLSERESYVDDYLDAALLIHHRSSSADIFAMATGRPVLLVHPPDAPPFENPYGTVVRQASDVVAETLRLLEKAHSFREANLSSQASLLSNPGCSIEYVLESLVAIREGRQLEGWLSLPLYRNDPAATTIDRFLQSALHAFAGNLPYRSLAREMTRRFPSSRMLNFLASVGLKRAGQPGMDNVYGSEAWLEALECFARCFSPGWIHPIDNALAGEFERWMTVDLPEMVTIATGWARKSGSEDVRNRLSRCIELLPILEGESSFAKALLRKPPSGRNNPAATDAIFSGLASEIAMLRISSGVDRLEKNDIAAAEIHFRRAREIAPAEIAPWIGLAHCALAKQDRPAFAECVARLETSAAGKETLPDLLARSRSVFPD